MLDLTRNATGYVELGTDGDTGLADLAFMFDETCIDSGARGSNFCTESIGEVEEELEVFLAAYAIAAGNDNRRVLDVYFRLFDVTVDDFNNEIGIVDIFLCVEIDDY